MLVHIRRGKGGKDRFVPLTSFTLAVLRRFWQVHQHPTFLFPNRKKTMKEVRLVTTSLNRGGVQKAMSEVVRDCGFKKTFQYTPYAIAMPRIY
jgi:integrase